MIDIPSRRLILLQIFIIFVLPIALLYFKVVSTDWRFFFVLVGSLFIYGITRHEKWTLRELGIRTDNFRKGILPYFIFTVLGVMVIYATDLIFKLPIPDTKEFYFRTFAFFVPLSFMQEWAFRSFLIPRLQLIYNSQTKIILLNSLLFTFIHVIYPSVSVGIPLSFLGGVFFAWIYLKYPNFLLISISHSILNITALLLGFFVPVY